VGVKVINKIFKFRYRKFKGFLRKAFDESNVLANEPAQKDQIEQSIQQMAGIQTFTEAELHAAYEQLSAENIIFIDGDQLILI
jgi:hypothetical protein